MHDRRMRKELFRNMDASRIPERGITIIADFTGNASACKTARDFASSLRDAGIPFQAFDTGRASSASASEAEGLVTPARDFDLRKYSHVIELYRSPLKTKIPGVTRGRIAFWEYESGFLENYPEMDDGVEMIAMSDFNRNYFRRIFPPSTPVRKILYPFRFPPAPPEPPDAVRRRHGIGETDFAVFFNFDYGSSVSRKKPDFAIKAFAMALKNEPDARLVFKTMRASDFPEAAARIAALAAETGIADRFVTIDRWMSGREIYGLANACDVFLSLHRGEGFGLGVAEALAIGKPAIVTDCSATAEFCQPGASFPVPFEMVDVKPEEIDHIFMANVKRWPEPDVRAAAEILRNLHRNRALATRTGERARTLMREMFSTERFRASVEAYLDGND